MCDKHRVTEEPCEAKVSRTVLESGGSREGVADFNPNRLVETGKKELLRESISVVSVA